jgi:hypothetical protein
MTAAVALRQTASSSQGLSLFDGTGGEPTLEELIAGVWEGLTAHASEACPICSGRLAPEYGAHARPIAGRCEHCGTRLS